MIDVLCLLQAGDGDLVEGSSRHMVDELCLPQVEDGDLVEGSSRHMIDELCLPQAEDGDGDGPHSPGSSSGGSSHRTSAIYNDYRAGSVLLGFTEVCTFLAVSAASAVVVVAQGGSFNKKG